MTVKHDKSSQPIYKPTVNINVMVPMRDGVKLAADIYRPDAKGKFPAILVRLPYGKTENYCEMPYFGWYFATRGYVFIAQDVRGKYDSDGVFEPQIHESKDGYDTQEWIAAQPWFNGNLGMTGDSYYGYTQWASAPLQHPSLKAMMTVVTYTNVYGDRTYINGAFQLQTAFGWTYEMAQTKTMLFNGIKQQHFPLINLRHLPLINTDEVAGRIVTSYKDMVKHPNKDAYWKGRSDDYPFEKVAIPILHVAGWHDLFIRGQLADYVAMTQRAATPAARRSQKLLVAAWHHEILRFGSPKEIRRNNFGPEKGFNFGPNADPNLLAITLRWFDYWLKEINNGIMDEPPIRIFVMGENMWRYEKEWPLKRTRYTKYYFHSNGHANSLFGDGTLTTQAPLSAEPTDTFIYDPNNPVPTATENPYAYLSTLKDQAPIEQRDDVLVYTSLSLNEAVETTGPLSVTLYVASTATDTDFTAKLVDVHPNNYAQHIQEGIVRARYRASRESPTLIEPRKIYAYTIDVWATSNVFKPGHKIRVEISSSNFPRFDRNPNTGHEFGMDAETIKATQTIHHDAQHPSYILLPIIPK